MTDTSPRIRALIAGIFYFLTFLTGGVAAFAGGKLISAGDAAATAANILAHEASFRLGFAAYLLNVACYIAVTALFYDLLKPVNRVVSLCAAFFSLVGCAIQASACLFDVAPLVVLKGAQYMSAFSPDQLQALALMFLKLHSQGFGLGLAFFGFYCLLIGYLIFRSTFLPRILGALMILGGLGWLTFLSPPLAQQLSPYILLPGVLAEGSLTLWLIAVGPNAQKWLELKNARRMSAA